MISIQTLIIICFFIINPKLSNLTSLVDITYKSGMWLDGNTVYYILYAAFGAILGNIQLNNNRFMLILLAPFLYFLSSVIIGYTTFIVSTNAGKYVGTFYHYNGVLVAIGAFSIFVFIKENARNMSLLDRPLNIIARNSLAIYGIHALILDFIYRQGYRDFYNPLIDIPLVFIITILLSLLIAITFKRLDKYNMIT